MSKLVNSQILQMQSFIVFLVISGIIFLGIHLLLCVKMKITNKRISYMGIFYEVSNGDIWVLATIYIRLIFVIWGMVTRAQFTLEEYLLYGILSAVIVLYILIRKGGFADVLGAIMVGLGILTGNILLNYNRQIVYEASIVYVYWCLAIFVILYTILISVRAVGKMSAIRRGTNGQIEFE